ncbi:TetR/AcrR family transcriptional regulator [Skermania sp. ID1734]|uniref:TetR/AcrR family transcriptional regulator n=1 Tax=Skermania sp. ID1734 TaxID=2597516 RepID=UPI00117D1A89|nr:TetR/AcrR family transcriptional regulator [Skermania sp. ID1734]TSE00056.1 TetR/AcrR family transcriptional regulator [Skermania sp. ID1734]
MTVPAAEPDVPATDSDTATGTDSDVRLRLVEALAATVAEKGYAATTIADIVARAHVSRRTFYEQFSDKYACLVACHEIVGSRMLGAIEIASNESADPAGLIERSARALLHALAAQPNLTYTHFVAMHANGPASVPRREVQDRLAKKLQEIATRVQTVNRQVVVPSDALATAVVGGIAELIVRSVEHDEDLESIAPTVTELVSGVLVRGRRTERPARSQRPESA